MDFEMKGFNYLPVLLEKLEATGPEKIILFGSYANGEPGVDSDLDILPHHLTLKKIRSFALN